MKLVMHCYFMGTAKENEPFEFYNETRHFDCFEDLNIYFDTIEGREVYVIASDVVFEINGVKVDDAGAYEVAVRELERELDRSME